MAVLLENIMSFQVSSGGVSRWCCSNTGWFLNCPSREQELARQLSMFGL